MIPLLIALAAIGGALLLRMLLKSKKKQEEAGKGYAAGESTSDGNTEQQSGESPEEAEKRKKIRTIEEKGGLLAKELHTSPDLSPEQLEVLYLAATQQDIRFDLATEQKIQAVPYPTANMDYVQINDASQLPQISPDQMVLDEDTFYEKFVTRDLMRPEYYDVVEMLKRLYILQDISPSMWEPQYARMQLATGETILRDTLARGIWASLLMDAVDGQAEYLLRRFADQVYNLHSVSTPAEAGKLLSRIVRASEHGSGTNIARAVTIAVADIRKQQVQDARMTHILLITDGDDQAGLTRQQLIEALREDIQLHVVLIGTSWPDTHPLAPYVIAKY